TVCGVALLPSALTSSTEITTLISMESFRSAGSVIALTFHSPRLLVLTVKVPRSSVIGLGRDFPGARTRALATRLTLTWRLLPGAAVPFGSTVPLAVLLSVGDVIFAM